MDFFTAVAAGMIPGWRSLSGYGFNDVVSTTITDIWSVGGIYTPLVTAATLEVLSDSVNDVNLTGSGAWTVFLYGLGFDGLEIEDTVELNGTTPVVTDKAFLRLFGSKVMLTGSTLDGADGRIEVRVSGGGAVQGEILKTVSGADWKLGRSKLGRITVPKGKTMFVYKIYVHNESTKAADVFIYEHANVLPSVPNSAPIVFKQFGNFSGHDDLLYSYPYKITQLTDIYARARMTSGTTGKINIGYNIAIYDGVL